MKVTEHSAVGVMIGLGATSTSQLIFGAVLAFLSHWLLDAGNREKPDEWGEHDHFVEDDPIQYKILYWSMIIIFMPLLAYYIWYSRNWYVLICVVCAIGIDWEYIPRAFGLDLQLHQKMWRYTRFMQTPRCRIAIFVVLCLVASYVYLGGV